MISETFFASNYISVWRTIAPTMDEFVRKTNMDGYTRRWHPIDSNTHPSRRGLINEAAFILFSRALKHDAEINAYWAGNEIGPSFDEAREYLRAASDHFGIDGAQTADEEKEAMDICGRLYRYFSDYDKNTVDINPRFNGCGILNGCHGDIVIDKRKIFEIKSGDRSFRSIDYRQISVYCALAYANNKHIFDNIILLNPRVGIVSEVKFSKFAYDVSGNSPIDFCQNLIESFTARFNSN